MLDKVTLNGGLLGLLLIAVPSWGQEGAGGGVTTRIELPNPTASVDGILEVPWLAQTGIVAEVFPPEVTGISSEDCGSLLVLAGQTPEALSSVLGMTLSSDTGSHDLAALRLTTDTGETVLGYCLPDDATLSASRLTLSVSQAVGWSGIGAPFAWGIWIALVAASAVIVRRFHRRLPEGRPASGGGPDEAEWLAEMLPIVRLQTRKVGNFFGYWVEIAHVLALYADELVTCTTWRRRCFDDVHRAGGSEGLRRLKRIWSVRGWSLQEIERVRVESPSKMRTVGITIEGQDRRRRFYLPERETPHLVRALAARLGSRVSLGNPIRPRPGWLLLMLVTSTGLPFLLSGGLLGWIGVFVTLWFPLAAGYVALLHLPRTTRVADEAERPAEDLSSRRPLRSKSLSRLCKLAAVLLLGVIFPYRLWQWMGGETSTAPFWGPWAILLGYFVVVNLLQLGHRLSRVAPADSRKADPRRPILYLRSFHDDRETSLHPETAFSAALGLDPPYHLIESAESLPIYPKLRAWVKYVTNYHPLRLWKLLVGQPLDTSEQQMASFFRRYGFFVAIGKPGEKFATTGAARMYVGNDEWQQTVAELLDEARIVLLQPSRTEGIWWEVEKVMSTVDPRRTLMCMVNYRDRQNDYESFRLRASGFLPEEVELPPAIGNHHCITFLSFDADWQPRQLDLEYYRRPGWIFRRRVVDLKSTLQSFLETNALADRRGRVLAPDPPSAVSQAA